MTQYVNDTFTGTDGTLISAHTGETGATWTVGTGFGTDKAPQISSANRLRHRASPSSGCWFASGVATTDGEYTEATVQTLSTASGFGIFARGHVNLSGACRGYMAYYSNSSGLWKILRLDNSTTFTQVGSNATQALSVASHTIRVTVTGTGASVQIVLVIDGSTVIDTTDTTGSRITTYGSPGVYLDGEMSDTTGCHIDSIIGVDAAGAAATSFVLPRTAQRALLAF